MADKITDEERRWYREEFGKELDDVNNFEKPDDAKFSEDFRAKIFGTY